MVIQHDVIVVGGGGSGLAAACKAAELGGKVLVLEKQSRLGGTTGIAVGTFTAGGTSYQRQAGIHDDPQAHAEDAGKFAPALEARNNHALRRFFLTEAAATLEWLRGLGLTFQGPHPEPPNRVPRMHNVVPGAKAYIAALQARVQGLGGTILCDCAVVGLVKEGRRVRGVRTVQAGTPGEFSAQRAVVLAAGDYAGSSELIRCHKGDAFGAVEGINPHATGNGHRLAEEAGGRLVNMDITYGPELRFVAPPGRPFQQVLPAGKWSGRLLGWAFRLLPRRLQTAFIKRLLVTWQHPENRLFDDGAILVNGRGERFTNELRSPARELAVAGQPGKVAYLLLDGRLVECYSAWPNFVSTAPEIAYAYVRDYQRLRPDVTTTAASLEELTVRRALEPGRLAGTLQAFNDYVAGKHADEFGRQGDKHPLAGGPWVLLGPVKAYFTTTEGGAVVNQDMQVLDGEGQVIPGLYAVGQNGLSGMVLWGHGLHIAWAITSGRLAAVAAMSEVRDA
jgi:succinate dehydrogenase/fumarate reductase flavoprotein subunit